MGSLRFAGVARNVNRSSALKFRGRHGRRDRQRQHHWGGRGTSAGRAQHHRRRVAASAKARTSRCNTSTAFANWASWPAQLIGMRFHQHVRPNAHLFQIDAVGGKHASARHRNEEPSMSFTLLVAIT